MLSTHRTKLKLHPYGHSQGGGTIGGCSSAYREARSATHQCLYVSLLR